MQSAYSWMGTRLHLLLEDKIAADFNQAQDAFFAAQKYYKETHANLPWDGVSSSLLIHWTEEQQLAWNNLARIINLIIEVNGGGLDITDAEITSDYLIKL